MGKKYPNTTLSGKESGLSRFFPLEIKGKTLNRDKQTLIMGVLNITPDSFYEGSRTSDPDECIQIIGKMIEEGADIIDIGGESTRPGSLGISAQQELDRIMPVVERAVKCFDITVSVDTTKSIVAEAVLSAGVSIINDISGLRFDKHMADCIAHHDAGVVIMHTTTKPVDMQKHTTYNSLIEDIIDYLESSLDKAENAGINRLSTIIDPGIGFGKTLEQNLTILNNLDKFLILNRPVLTGTSRKSFIGKILGDIPAGERLEGTLASVAVSIIKGAMIVRVHDVREAKLASCVADAIYLS